MSTFDTDCTPTDFYSADVSLQYDLEGHCWTPAGAYVCELKIEHNSEIVRLHLDPRGTNTVLLDERMTTMTPVPPTPADKDPRWDPTEGRSVTIYFEVPPAGSTWGWDFSGTQQPTPLRLKVRVKRP